jgi:hypothetical protein
MNKLKETYLFIYQVCHLNLRQWDIEQINCANDDSYH